MTKRVLVTGGSGFIGQHALAFLKERGFEVHAPSHAELDVLDADAVSRYVKALQPTYVLHFAWIATPGVYPMSPENQRWKDASMHLFREAVRSGATRIVGAGSCFEYEWPQTPCIEDETPTDNPTTLYGKYKNACRKELMDLADEEGISAAWGRIFYLYGPGEPEKKLIASVITTLLKGETAQCTHCKQVRDFLYAKDVGSAFAALLESGVDGTVNIASGEAVTLKELVTTAAKIIGVEDKLAIGAKEAPPNEPPVIAADTRKLTRDVGWTRNYSHDEGLRESIAWWKEKLGL